MALHYLTHKEVETFFGVVDDERDNLIFTLMYQLGLRVSEVVGEDVDYWIKDKKRLWHKDVPDAIKTEKVNQKFKYNNSMYCHNKYTIPGFHTEDIDWENRLLAVRGKGRKTRYVKIPKHVLPMMFNYIKPNTPTVMRGKVFAIGRHGVTYLCKKYSKIADMRVTNPHIFRHTFAMFYLARGGDIRALQKLLGHSSLLTTQQYAELTNQSVGEDMDKVMEGTKIIRTKEETEELKKKVSTLIGV